MVVDKYIWLLLVEFTHDLEVFYKDATGSVNKSSNA